jgi:predicted phage-related endonuclease
MLVKWEADFWEHVKSDIPPSLDGSEASAKYLKKKFPNSVPRSTIQLPHTAVELIRLYDEACGKGDEYSDQKQRAENLLKEMLGDNEVGIAGDRIITWKTVNRDIVDSKALKAEQPNIYKQYANNTSYRRFNVKAAS